MGAVLFVAALSLFLLTASGIVQTIDVDQSVEVARSIVTDGDVAITGFPDTPGGGVVEGRDGRFYSPHAIGMPALFVPIAAVEHWGGGNIGVARLGYAFVDALFSAATVLVLFFFVRRLAGRTRVALVAATILAVATTVWPFAHLSFDAAPTGFFLLLSVALAHRAARDRRWRSLLGAGLAAAAAILIRVDSVIVVGFESVWMLAVCIGAPRGVRWRSVVAWTVPLLGAAAVTVGYNLVRFGALFDDGHTKDPQVVASTPIWEGLGGQLVSPGKGIIFFAPPVLLALVGWWLLRHREAALTSFVVVSSVVYVALHARLANWSGELTWGPRFVVPLVPLFMVSLGVVLVRWRDLGHLARAGIIAICLLGTAVQVGGVFVDYNAVTRAHGALLQPEVWRTSQIDLAWRALGRSLIGEDPYPSVGSIDDPVEKPPRFDFWWIRPQVVGSSPTLARMVAALMALVFLGASGWLVVSARRNHGFEGGPPATSSAA